MYWTPLDKEIHEPAIIIKIEENTYQLSQNMVHVHVFLDIL
jgi:hypothetical protein